MMDSADFIVTGKLSKSELNFLRKTAEDFKRNSVQAEAYFDDTGKGRVDEDFRRGRILYLKPERKTRKIYNIIHSHMIHNYSKVFKNFDYSNLPKIQYAYYDTGDFFKTHMDTIKLKKNTARCLTMSINLSDPDEYGGGEMLIYVNEDTTVKLNRDAGSFIIFPSFFYHEAKVVEHGDRCAIVSCLHDSKGAFNEFYYYVNGA